MDRYWFLTSTFYGNWLPGNPLGFVSKVLERRTNEERASRRGQHDIPGTAYDHDVPGLLHWAKDHLRSAPVRIDVREAEFLIDQFLETASHRGWQLLATSVMANHVHWVVGVPGDPPPRKILGDFKAYGSRRLTEKFGPPPAEWWTYGGSKRLLESAESIVRAVIYTCEQDFPLRVWLHPDYEYLYERDDDLNRFHP